ncbi:MAG: hypothetical protein MZU95_02365 [Desulfomicrobium escambiense]|nr:hypothetical protein [Desulfomicrobium escambiense]
MVNSRWRRAGHCPASRPTRRKAGPPDGAFRLTTGGCGLHDGGRTVNNPLLHQQMPENVLWMNPAAAAGLGIADGETVTVAQPGRLGPHPGEADRAHPPGGRLHGATGFGRTPAGRVPGLRPGAVARSALIARRAGASMGPLRRRPGAAGRTGSGSAKD